MPRCHQIIHTIQSIHQTLAQNAENWCRKSLICQRDQHITEYKSKSCKYERELYCSFPITQVLSALCHFCLRIRSSCQTKSLPQVPWFEPQLVVWEGAGGEGGGEGGLGGEGGEGGWVDLAWQVEWVESRSWRIVMLRSLRLDLKLRRGGGGALHVDDRAGAVEVVHVGPRAVHLDVLFLILTFLIIKLLFPLLPVLSILSLSFPSFLRSLPLHPAILEPDFHLAEKHLKICEHLEHYNKKLPGSLRGRDL